MASNSHTYKVGDLVRLKVVTTTYGSWTYGPRSDQHLNLLFRMLDGTVGEVTRQGTKIIYAKFVTTSPSGRIVEQEHRLESNEVELVFSS